jgi:glycine/serine hydroxymethyltransferase
MTRPIVRIHNIATDEIIDREMNDEEFAQHQIDVIDNEKRIAEAEAREASRQAVLDRLGLTAEEASILLG